MMQETGSNIENSSNIILSIRFTPNGLYYSITIHGVVKILNFVEFTSDEIGNELNNILTNINNNYNIVNVIIDTCNVTLVPEEMLGIYEDDAAQNILKINSIEFNQNSTAIITEAKYGIRAIMATDPEILHIFKDNFKHAKFHSSILTNISIDPNAIIVTINDESISINCNVNEQVVYADVMSKDTDIATVIYYIQSLKSQFEKKNYRLPVYITGSRCIETTPQIKASVSNVKFVANYNDDTLNNRDDISNYNDLIQLS